MSAQTKRGSGDRVTTESVEEECLNAIVQRSTSPLKFFVLVFALSVPFWLLGAVTDLQLLPGLPMSALALVCPVTAAAILVHRQNGTPGVIRLLKRALDHQRISSKAWYSLRHFCIQPTFAVPI